ncbi:hypothetical protein VUN82_11060 [Micrococcaceae bacterium Sec5.1]
MSQATGAYTPEPIIPGRQPECWIAAALILVLLAMFVEFILTSQAIHLDIIGKYLFEATILSGVLLTIELTLLATLIGHVLGVDLGLPGNTNPGHSSELSRHPWPDTRPLPRFPQRAGS